jgi:hypothetical protein
VQALRAFARVALVLSCAWGLHACLGRAPRADAPLRWWKGNTHAHTLWSDGDGAPQAVVEWYRDAGYDFLVLSDHNVLAEGERWFPVAPDSRLTQARLEALIAAQPAGDVEWREGAGGPELRLQTLSELRARFERPGEFLLVTGEEVTSEFEGAPVHVNALNTREVLGAQRAESVRDLLATTLRAIEAQGRRLGVPTLAHLNHPNFQWGVSWEDVAAVPEARFFEVSNGHPATNDLGDAAHPSTERLWDLVLARRLTELDLGLVYGLATDDGHNYHELGPERANPGRGWIVVRARDLSPDALLEAMRRGDFHASSGVEIDDVRTDVSAYVVSPRARAGEVLVTRFLGLRATPQGFGEPGELLLETAQQPARYVFAGDEVYVRAVVSSSLAHPRARAQEERQQAWLQPVLGPAGAR